MSDIKEYIDSGVLEMYVLGIASEEEAAHIAQLRLSHPEVEEEIRLIEESLEAFALASTQQPPITAKPFTLAIINYIERLQAGETPSNPPIITAASKPSDYSVWLDRSDLQLPEDYNGMHAWVIGHNDQATTAIAWISDMAPEEVHESDYEKFLILEGSCAVHTAQGVQHFHEGDVLIIEPGIVHTIKITSDIPCKVILQRHAA